MPDNLFVSDILEFVRKRGGGALRAFFQEHGRAMLFERQGGEFRLLWREGYGGPGFAYSFLEDEPHLLLPALKSGVSALPARVACDPSCRIFAVAEPPGEPLRLLLCELPGELPASDLGAFQLLLALSDRAPVFKQAPPVWVEPLLRNLSRFASPVLVQGEPGSMGRMLVERFADASFGLRQLRWFSPGRLSEPVQLRELFGDSVGARLSGGGEVLPFVERPEFVLGVDEVGRLSLQAQLRLLDYLHEAPKSHHWVFLSTLDLEALVESGRLSAVFLSMFDGRRLAIPPVRSLVEEIGTECQRLLSVYRDRYGRVTRLGEGALQVLQAYDWPGNWEELSRTLLAAFLTAKGDEIGPEDLQLGLWRPVGVADELNLRARTADLEKELILHAFALHGGNQVRMAESLGISRGALQNKLQKYGMARR